MDCVMLIDFSDVKRSFGLVNLHFFSSLLDLVRSFLLGLTYVCS